MWHELLNSSRDSRPNKKRRLLVIFISPISAGSKAPVSTCGAEKFFRWRVVGLERRPLGSRCTPITCLRHYQGWAPLRIVTFFTGVSVSSGSLHVLSFSVLHSLFTTLRPLQLVELQLCTSQDQRLLLLAKSICVATESVPNLPPAPRLHTPGPGNPKIHRRIQQYQHKGPNLTLSQEEETKIFLWFSDMWKLYAAYFVRKERICLSFLFNTGSFSK